MYVQDHLNALFADQYHYANIKNFKNFCKAHYDIEQSRWFKSSASTLQGFFAVILSRLSSSLFYNKKRKMIRLVVGRINMVGSVLEVSKVLVLGEKY